MLKKKKIKKIKNELLFEILLRVDDWSIHPSDEMMLESNEKKSKIIILLLKEIIKELQKNIKKEKKN